MRRFFSRAQSPATRAPLFNLHGITPSWPEPGKEPRARDVVTPRCFVITDCEELGPGRHYQHGFYEPRDVGGPIARYATPEELAACRARRAAWETFLDELMDEIQAGRYAS